MQKLVLCFSAFLFFSLNLFSQVTHTVNFTSENLSITEITGEDENIYTKVEYEDLYHSDEIGNPELPVKLINLIIPTDQRVSEVTLRLSNEEYYEIENLVFPVQPDIPTSINYIEVEFITPNPEIYESEDPYPPEIVKIIHDGYFDGNNHIVTLAVYPVQYFPTLNQLIFYPDIEITLEMESTAPPNIHVENRKESNQEIYDNILLKMVDNPEDVPSYQIRARTTEKIEGMQRTIENYEYVIITSDALESSFSKFIEWKKRKGLDIGVVTVEEILSTYSGDLISGIYDDAGKIRQFLYESYIGGTVWALLAGDFSVVPLRYGCGLNNPSSSDYIIPADLYFADFTSDWNVDGDGFYGELTQDQHDRNPEIFVGRILISEETGVQDIENWTEKIIRYEQNPGEGNLSYLNQAFWTEADQLNDYSANVSTHLPASFDHTIWSEFQGCQDHFVTEVRTT